MPTNPPLRAEDIAWLRDEADPIRYEMTPYRERITRILAALTQRPETREPVASEELGEWMRVVREAIWYARVTAHSHGYALAVHGSLRRDIDVVAVPWTGEAISPDELAEKIVAWLVTVGVCHEDTWKAATKTREEKPHGRLAWSVSLRGPLSLTSRGECAPYLDLSVMPLYTLSESQP